MIGRCSSGHRRTSTPTREDSQKPSSNEPASGGLPGWWSIARALDLVAPPKQGEQTMGWGTCLAAFVAFRSFQTTNGAREDSGLWVRVRRRHRRKDSSRARRAVPTVLACGALRRSLLRGSLRSVRTRRRSVLRDGHGWPRAARALRGLPSPRSTRPSLPESLCCSACSSQLRIPALSRRSQCCHECLRTGRVSFPKVTELGVIGWAEAVKGLESAKIPAEELLELVRTPKLQHDAG